MVNGVSKLLAATGQGTLEIIMRLSENLVVSLLLAVGAWFFWEVGLRRGTKGANRYGPDPLGA
jgi:uncharacterized membrane protein YhaH (DUF805 family)